MEDKNATKPLTREHIEKILSDPEEIKRRIKYAYWVPDGKGWGHHALVASPEEVPSGIPFHEVICMGE